MIYIWSIYDRDDHIRYGLYEQDDQLYDPHDLYGLYYYDLYYICRYHLYMIGDLYDLQYNTVWPTVLLTLRMVIMIYMI